MFQRLLSTITWHLCKESVFAVLALLFQDLCNSTGHVLNHLLGQILTDSNPFCHNHFLEFVRISGVLFVHLPLEDWPQIINGIKIPGHGPRISTFWSPSHLVITFALWHGAPSCWKMHCSSPNCCWIVGRSCCWRLFWYHSWFMAVFWGQNCEWAHSLGWEATSHMNGLRMLYCWHDTGLMVALTLNSPDKPFSRCPKQSETGVIGENDFAPVLSSPFTILSAEDQSAPRVFFEEKGLLCCLLDTRPSSKSLRLTVRADALTPACCHSWARSALVTLRSRSWILFRRRSWRLLDFLGRPEAFLSRIECLSLKFLMIL